MTSLAPCGGISNQPTGADDQSEGARNESSRPWVESRTATKLANEAEASISADRAHEYGRGRPVGPSRPSVQMLADLPDLAERLSLSVLVDALREAMPAYWLRRAEQLESIGTPFADGAAAECRRHAWLLAQMSSAEVAEFFDLEEAA